MGEKELTLNAGTRDLQALLLKSGETSSCPQRVDEESALQQLRDVLPASAAKCKNKPEMLFLVHLHRQHKYLTVELKNDLDQLLTKWRLVLSAMAMIGVKIRSGDVIAAAINLHRSLVQALD